MLFTSIEISPEKDGDPRIEVFTFEPGVTEDQAMPILEANGLGS